MKLGNHRFRAMLITPYTQFLIKEGNDGKLSPVDVEDAGS